mgnify:CR=1 FL=1
MNMFTSIVYKIQKENKYREWNEGKVESFSFSSTLCVVRRSWGEILINPLKAFDDFHLKILKQWQIFKYFTSCALDKCLHMMLD